LHYSKTKCLRSSLIITGRLGPAAQAWFLPPHILGIDGYRYDHDSDHNLEDVDRLWDRSDEGFTGHAERAEDDDSYNGMAIDFGDFLLELDSHSRILGDDSASVATLGIPKSHGDDQMEIDQDADSDDDIKDTTASAADGSTLTDATPQLTIHDSIANLLANTSLDPTIRQAIENSQRAAAMVSRKK
jgi:hypothetical protein